MADFNTHVSGAAAVITLGTVSATKLFSLSMQESLVLMVVGVTGGVLPDLDLKNSRPSQALFTVLGVFAGLIWLFASIKRLTGLELWLGTLVIVLLFRFPIAAAFHRLTTHRGVFHSLLAAITAGLITCAIAWQYIQTSALLSWLFGLSMSCGYVVHLLLDELYSVDFAGGRIKRSFGSAIKPVALKQPKASAMVAVIAMTAWLGCAPYTQAVDEATERYSHWQSLLVPEWWPEAAPD